MMFFVKNKAEEGYSFSAVANWVHENVRSNQATFLTKQDVANVAQKWRQANKHLELRTAIEEPTQEDIEKKRCVDLINSTTEAGLMRALASVCESIPEALKVALPVLEALQKEKNNQVGATPDVIQQGSDLRPPSPGFPTRRPPTPPPTPLTRPAPVPSTAPRLAPQPQAQTPNGINSVGLRWRDPEVGKPSPLPPPQRPPPRRAGGAPGAPTMPPPPPPSRQPVESQPYRPPDRSGPGKGSQGPYFPPTLPSSSSSPPTTPHGLPISGPVNYQVPDLPLPSLLGPSTPYQPPRGNERNNRRLGPNRTPGNAHGNMYQPRDSNGMWPSWLKPLDAEQSNKQEGREKEKEPVIDPTLLIEDQLQNELGANRVSNQANTPDQKVPLASKLPDRAESRVRTSLEAELLADQHASRVSRPVGLQPMDPDEQRAWAQRHLSKLGRGNGARTSSSTPSTEQTQPGAAATDSEAAGSPGSGVQMAGKPDVPDRPQSGRPTSPPPSNAVSAAETLAELAKEGLERG
jgi:hypothetical protein